MDREEIINNRNVKTTDEDESNNYDPGLKNSYFQDTNVIIAKGTSISDINVQMPTKGNLLVEENVELVQVLYRFSFKWNY